MDLKRAFGQAVREARQEQALSQHRLAEEADVDHTYISSLERGLRNPTLVTQDRIATALGVRLAVLVEAAESLRER